MSTATTPSVVSPTSTKTNTSGVAQLIDERIGEACRALWWAELTRAVLKLVIVLIGTLLIWLVIDQWIYAPGPGGRAMVLLSLIGAVLWYAYRQIIPLLGRSIRPEYAARAVERDFPQLRQSLTSYIALRDQTSTSGLRGRVVRSIGSAAASHLRKHDVLPSEATGTMRLWLATIAMLAVTLAYVVASPKSAVKSTARLLAPMAAIDPVARVSITDVDPGDTTSIAGRSVVVTAKIDGLREGEQAMLRWYHQRSTSEASSGQSAAMQFDPTYRHFVARVTLDPSAAKPVWYTIEAGDSIAGPYQINVEDVPVIAIESIRYQPPGYTGEPPWTNSGGAISALDGTRVSVIASTNRPVAKATMEFNPRPIGDAVQATAGATAMQIDKDGMRVSATFPLRSSRGRSAAVELDSYRISVWDAGGGRNPEPIVYPIEVFTDLPPDVAIMLPTKSPKDLPIDAQQVIEVHASDPDYGLQQISLDIRAGIDQIDQPVLWQNTTGAKGNQIGLYRLRPSEHGLRMGDTISVVAVATDNRLLEHDPSVEPNASRTDPIEIRIVASAAPPQPNDPEADGVSAPDDRPAAEPTSDASQSGQPGQQAQGSGGSGQGAGQQQQEGEASGGAGSSGQSGETESPERRSPDSSRSNSGDSGQSSGESSSSKSSSSKSSSDESSGGTSPNSSNEQPAASDSSNQASSENARQGQQASETGKSEQSGSKLSDAEPSDSDAGEATADQPSSNQDSQSAQDRSTSNAAQADPRGEDSNSNRQNESQTTGDEGDSTPSDDSDPASPTESSRSGEPNPDGESAKGEPNQPPQHDGEAMERIREYLENKQRGPSSNGGGNQSPNQPDAGEPSESNQPDDGQTEQPQSERGQSERGQSEQGQSEQGQSQSGQSGSQPQGESSAKSGAESSGDQNIGDGKAAEESNSQQSENQPSGAEPSPSKSAPSQSANNDAAHGKDGSDPSSDQQGKPKSASEQSGESTNGPPRSDGDEQPQPSSDSEPNTNPASPSSNESKPSNQNRSTDSDSDAGIGGQGEGRGGDADVPPEQANPEYAKEATDMVLDYLEETRDQPDRELLEKLNWTDEDLKRFADRWKNIRQQAERSADPQAKRELDEALRSLGMKPNRGRGTSLNRSDRGDTLRDVRDTGNRRPPPAAYRDAFDAFRRAAGRN